MFRFVFLGSDILLFSSLFLLSLFIIKGLRKPINQKAVKKLLTFKIAWVTLSILSFYLVISLIDSVHFQRQLLTEQSPPSVQYAAKIESVLDVLFGERATPQEKTYSAPFALQAYIKEINPAGGQYYPKLRQVNSSLNTEHEKRMLIVKQLVFAFLASMLLVSVVGLCCFYCTRKDIKRHYSKFFTLMCFTFIIIACCLLESQFHLLGTDKIGQDVFYLTIKSIRTGLVIGLITTMVTLPFALVLGLSAGYFGGKVDDLIQYTYITISSIPGVLLIAASILSMQVYISNHPEIFTTLMARSDARLIALCFILGLTGWTGLCRLLRAETLKLRELDYIQAARALGSSNRFIVQRHVLPNVMHLIVIATVLDFSSLVLAEAVLSYIGVGVSPLTISWGNMINGARMELAREPMVWWPMLAAFIFMFLFVISINLLADKIRDVFDPRSC